MFNHRNTRNALVTLAATASSVVVAALISLFAMPAGAQGTGSPVGDYSSYPAPLPAGCPDGAGALTGAQFDNGRGGTETDLRRLDLRNDDTLTMTWQDYAPGCLTSAGVPNIVVSLAAYHADTAVFDPSVDQQLLPGWQACGPGMTACGKVGARYQLSMTMPSATVACNMQVEAVIGLPLAVVGPHGSYYNSLLRGDQRPNMLIAATNVTTQPCPPAAAVVTEVPPSAPVVESAPAVSSPPAVLAETQAAPVTTAAAPQQAAAPVAVEAATASLPATGRGDGPLLALGLGLVAAGCCLLLAGWHIHRGRGIQDVR